jgi:GNAT superfamily N-acetyltransferase
MNLEIKPLTFELANDYLDFFDNKAFSDDNPNGPCYCVSPSLTSEAERRMIDSFGNDPKTAMRRIAEDLLTKGGIRGYLAYDRGNAIGWCNAGDMRDYPDNGWIPPLARESACGPTVCVLCFAISTGYFGRGVATALLKRVAFDAKLGDYAAVEGYVRKACDSRLSPIKSETEKEQGKLSERDPYDFQGPIGLFRKLGFKEAADLGDKTVMRLVF